MLSTMVDNTSHGSNTFACMPVCAMFAHVVVHARACNALAVDPFLWNCWCCSHWIVDIVLGVEPRCLQVSAECFCWNVFGENVCWILVSVVLVESHDVMRDQLLNTEVFQVDGFWFPWWSYPCCHAFATWRAFVDLDVDFLHVEDLHEEVA